jgi:hypothetical protein
MAIIELPAWRLSAGVSRRSALRSGVAMSQPAVRLVKGSVTAFCDRCAAPIDNGAVMNGGGTYCSVECSLGGGRSA